MIDLSRAIRYPFAGPNALTRMFTGAFMFVLSPVFGLTGLALLGYQLRIIRAVIEDEDRELPDWDLATDFVQGIVVLAGTALYYLPSFILAGLGARLAWDVVAGMNIDLFGMALEQRGPQIDRGEVSMICLTFALALIWMLLSAPLVMAAVARYAETGQFSAFTQVLTLADEVWEQRGAAGKLALSLFLLAILAQAISMVASVTCLLSAGVQFVQFAAIAHLNGQWGSVLKQHRPTPNVIRPIKPPPWHTPG